MKYKIQVPENLNEITLEQYQRFDKVNTKENEDSAFLLQKTVEIFCRLELNKVAKIKFASIKNVIADLNKVFVQPTKLIPTFKLDNVNFGFIPVLDDMTLGEYVDLDANIKGWESMHKAMSVLYRPITYFKNNKYQIEEYTGIKHDDLLLQMPLSIVFGAMVFFWNLNKELVKTTLSYLQKHNQLTIQQREILEKNGDGINQSMDSLKEMLPSLMRSQL